MLVRSCHFSGQTSRDYTFPSTAGHPATARAGRGCRGPRTKSQKANNRRFAGINGMNKFWNKAKPTLVTIGVALVGILVVMWILTKFAPRVRSKIGEATGL